MPVIQEINQAVYAGKEERVVYGPVPRREKNRAKGWSALLNMKWWVKSWRK